MAYLIMLLSLQKLFVCVFLFVLVPTLCTAQDFNYVHYDTKDGLAGSTVYRIAQDRDGFLWFGTENGLSRFDGTRFTNFTVANGLPDNEIILLEVDSLGRLWIFPFKKDLAYYYKNRIHNRTNDSALAKVNLESTVISVAQDEKGNIALQDSRKINLFMTGDSLKVIYQVRDEHFKKGIMPGVRYDFHEQALLVGSDSIYAYENGRLRFLCMLDKGLWSSRTRVPLISLPRTKYIPLELPEPYISYHTARNNVTFVNTSNGTWKVDTIARKLTTHFLPGKKVSATIEDSEGALWFGTMGGGVYKLASEEMKTIAFPVLDKYNNKEIFSLEPYGDNLVCGMSYSKAMFLNGYTITDVLNLEHELYRAENKGRSNRLFRSKTISNDVILLGFDSYLAKLEKGKVSLSYIFPIKSIDKIDEDFAMIGTSRFVFKIRVKDLSVVDTLWRERCTDIFFHNNKYYIGTLNGLYEVGTDKSSRYLGDLHPVFQRRIADIQAGPAGELYVATHDEGIVIYKDGEIAGTITESDGLSSNICRTLFLYRNFLWVGTNKGLNRVDITNKNTSILKYSNSDGLPSNDINAIYVKDSIVWVGSPAGLTYFNEKKISSNSICNLELLDVTVSGKKLDISDHYRLSHANNNISFEFIAISPKSDGDVVYHYRLDPLDSEWKETRQSHLVYQSLPSGGYELELYAINKFGVKSETIRISFLIDTPFWQRWWFYSLLVLLVVAITFWIVNRRTQAALAQKEQQNRIQQQFADLEQQALQAQMNPHFIFNCLNSIQQYILTNDKEKANQYLTGFATLIRQTLDNSVKKTITVSEEVSYLNRYLQMEAMRFGENFSYEITVDDMIRMDMTEMPAMLLQPYVENCLRHGIRYKTDGTGKVTISFSIVDDTLYCRIKDNGIGREKAAELKSRQHIEYQSQGMRLTEKRIELLNKINTSEVSVSIVDLKDDHGNAAGTEVILKIPL